MIIGFQTKKNYEGTEAILQKCPKLNLTIGISIDGLEETHEKIRGIKTSFKKCVETAHNLSELRKKYNIVFIDGDHRKEGVIKDWEAYSELVSTGGVVIFDDHWLGVLGERYAWAKNKRHWDEPERMYVVGAYEEIKFRPMFLEKWKQVGLVVDKLILQRR